MKHTLHCLPYRPLPSTDVSGGHLPKTIWPQIVVSGSALRGTQTRKKKKKTGRKEGKGKVGEGRKKEGGKEERRWNERKEKKWGKTNILNPITLILQLLLGRLPSRWLCLVCGILPCASFVCLLVSLVVVKMRILWLNPCRRGQALKPSCV